MLQAQPELCFQSALALTFTTERRSSATWTRAGQLLQWAEQGFEAKEQREQLGEALQLHADLAFFQEDLVRMFALVYQAQPLLTEHSLMYPDNLVIRGFEALLAGEVNMAWQCLNLETDMLLERSIDLFVASKLHLKWDRSTNWLQTCQNVP